MNIAELLDAAKRQAGSLGAVAQKMGVNQARLSEWRKGKYKPDATNIAELAEIADLPVFQTLAEIECDLETDRASVWERALGNLKAAGVAATVVLGVTALTAASSTKAEASEHDWCARLGSNQQPLPSEGSTLSIELRALL